MKLPFFPLLPEDKWGGSRRMYTEKLEIRGVNLKDIFCYLHQLGGRPCPHSSPSAVTVFDHPDWRCHVEQKEPFIFMHSTIPKVHVQFFALDKDHLEHVVKLFRLKTFRAGG